MTSHSQETPCSSYPARRNHYGKTSELGGCFARATWVAWFLPTWKLTVPYGCKVHVCTHVWCAPVCEISHICSWTFLYAEGMGWFETIRGNKTMNLSCCLTPWALGCRNWIWARSVWHTFFNRKMFHTGRAVFTLGFLNTFPCFWNTERGVVLK